MNKRVIVFFIFFGSMTTSFCQGQPRGAEATQLMGNRFFTLSTVVRVNQIETSRNEFHGEDESTIHSPAEAKVFRETVERSWPGARITWAFSWLALQDQRDNYRELRKVVVAYHHKYGDEITFLPGGYFANMYNSREQVNLDLHDGLKMVSDMVGDGYRPQCVIAGFLSAENLRYLAEVEDIHVCQGNIWSQYAIDNGDGEGSISYPYYPSREHFLKPAQGRDDFIDCVNLDGWTMDFLSARFPGGRMIDGDWCGSRQGVGPIETVIRLGTERGTREMLHCTETHFDTGFALNGFAWVTCTWELCLVEGRKIYGYQGRNGMEGMEIWFSEMRRRWPDAKCITHGEFGLLWRDHFKSNDSLNYRFVQRGSGICGSEPELEIAWYMNKDFRMATLRNRESGEKPSVIDFTRYDLKAKEPEDPKPGQPIRNWSLMNRLNQKGIRPVDKPVDITELDSDDKMLIQKRYPMLMRNAAMNDGESEADTEEKYSARWTIEMANEWYANQPWACGFNYVPANAISYTEMWMPYCFDTTLIDKELTLAQKLGFNCLRVVLPFVVWEHDPEAFKNRLNVFLNLCERHHVKVMLTLFDDCAFGSDPNTTNPVYGKQPEVLKGWYANGWTASPGHAMVRDPETWPRLELYVKDVIQTYRMDPRVWVWDLYNEPTNSGTGNAAIPLVVKVFSWAREMQPTQPLTIAQWNGNAALNKVIHDNCDITTFHNYQNAWDLLNIIHELKKYGRPLINTEWMCRHLRSDISSCLPVFHHEGVGCMLWGLVNGKTQTHLHWGWRPEMGEPSVWQHDLFHHDHTPYDANEILILKDFITRGYSTLSEPRPVIPGYKGSPPSDAIILFSRDSLDHFVSMETGVHPEWTVSGEIFTVKPGTKNICTKEKFGDCQLHIEWSTPLQDQVAGKTGQQSGNSGIYLMSKYEVQVLNSFVNKTSPTGQAAAFYGHNAPMVNASVRPGEWQTYDIVFIAPSFDENENLLEPGYLTLFHNGVLVLNHVEVTAPTASHSEDYPLNAPELPLMLQDHNSEVSYRNIWIRKL